MRRTWITQAALGALICIGCDDQQDHKAAPAAPEAPEAEGAPEQGPYVRAPDESPREGSGEGLSIVSPESGEEPEGELELIEVEPEGPAGAWSSRYPAVAAGGLIEMHFTRPGTERGAEEDPEADDAIIEVINGAQFSLDLCLYEFNRQNVVDAVVDAIARGVNVRFVGDGDEIHDEGYEILAAEGLDLVLRRPRDRIMHHKFVVADASTVLTGSMNFSRNGVMLNNNHVLRVDSEALALAYMAEFQQMYEGSFGRRKDILDVPQQFEIGGANVELFFSPQDNTSAEMLRLLRTADHNVLFMVFSFTLDEVAAEMERLNEAGVRVVGVFDESQGRSRYAQDDRLAEAGVPVFIDGNKNAIGFAGGKLHHKVMIIDAGTDSDPVVISGSYNWSNGATKYNDENMIVLHGQEFAVPFLEEFCKVLEVAEVHPKLVGERPDPCAELLTPVRINEVLPNPDGPDADEEFVELINPGASAQSLDGWTLADALKVRHTFGPDDVLVPGGVMVIYGGALEGDESRVVASSGGLALTNNAETVVLRNPEGVVVDEIAYRNARSGISFNRDPDGAGDGVIALHTLVSPDGLTMSPGLRADGRLWPGTPRVVINELLPNPSGTDRGQEYVELINAGTGRVDLTGWSLGDLSAADRHVFDGTELAPGEVLVIFDQGDHAAIAGAINSSSGSLSLNNGGDTITLFDAAGGVADQVIYGDDLVEDGISLNRASDGEIEAEFVLHTLVEGALGNMSPGLRSSGEDFIEPPPVQAVMINELLPNPVGTDRGQEYIELVNVGEVDVDLAGWTLGDAVSANRHVFSGPQVLPVGESIVIFDRGEHPEVPGHLVASSGSLSLNNSNERVVLFSALGVEMDSVVYEASVEGVALNRATDADQKSELINHDEVEGAVDNGSPGLRVDGTDW
ncbi:MAG: lamin tail domain-containing protein [Bradymonadia bacterium]